MNAAYSVTITNGFEKTDARRLFSFLVKLHRPSFEKQSQHLFVTVGSYVLRSVAEWNIAAVMGCNFLKTI
jgi:hypothetical protein